MKTIMISTKLILLLAFLGLGINQSVKADNLSVSQQILNLSEDAEQLLNLAEQHFGQFFSPSLNTQFAPPEWLYYRGPYTNNIYIGVNIDGYVYLLGGDFGNTPLRFGAFQEVLTMLQNIGSTNTISPAQLSGMWWQLVTSSCSFVSCTESAFLYTYDLRDCVQDLCTGSRQSWINNGNGWNAPQALPFSFVWTLRENILQLSFSAISGRVETFNINKFIEAQGILELSSNDFNSTQFIKCGSRGFPIFIADALGC